MTIIFDLIYKEGTIISSGGEKNLELLKHVSQAFKQLLRIHFERPLSIVEEKKEKKRKKKEEIQQPSYNRGEEIRFLLYLEYKTDVIASIDRIVLLIYL